MRKRVNELLTQVARKIPKPVLYIFLSVMMVYFLFWSFMFFSYNDWGKSGSLGDSFGILNALLSSIGTAGIIYTIYIQIDTIKSQDTLLELQTKTMETSIKPLLDIDPKGEEKGAFKITIVNVGNGSAINIKIISTKIPIVNENKYLRFEATNDGVFSLRKDASRDIFIKPYADDGREYEDLFIALLEKKYSNMVVEFIVHYQDVNFKFYKQVIKLGLSDGSIEMAEH